MKKNNGFSIVELLIVIGIIGIIMSIALPAFGNLMQRNRLKEAVQALQDDLQYARTQAIKNSQNVVLSVTTGNAGAWCYGLTANASCSCSSTPSTCEIKTVSGSAFKTTSVTTGGDLTFDFRRGTITPSTAATNRIIFSTSNYAAAVAIDAGSTTSDTSTKGGKVVICNLPSAAMPTGKDKLSGFGYCQ